MTAASLGFVWRYADNVPSPDEWSMVPVATGHAPLTWSWLWSPWLGHRLPLPRLALLALYKLGGLDFRVAQYFQVAALSALSLLLMRTATHLRGRPSWSDSFFPLVLLSWVHWNNWLCGWQIQFTLSVCLTLLLMVCGVYGRWTWAGVCLLLLPMFGSNGVVVAAAVIPWLLFHGVRLRSGPLLVFPALAAAEIGLYLYGLPVQSPPLYHPAPLCRLQDVAEMLGMQVGHGDPQDASAFEPSWWLWALIALCYLWSIAVLASQRLAALDVRARRRVIASCAAGGLLLLALVSWAKAGNRLPFYETNPWQLLGLLLLVLVILSLRADLRSAVMVGVVLLAFAIAWRRPYPEFVTADRYVLLWTPLFVGVYLYGGAVQAPLALVVLLSLLSALPFSDSLAARRHAELRRFVFAVRKGTPLESANFCYRDAFGGRWTYQGVHIYYNPAGSLRSDLEMLRDAGHPTFAGYRPPAETPALEGDGD